MYVIIAIFVYLPSKHEIEFYKPTRPGLLAPILQIVVQNRLVARAFLVF